MATALEQLERERVAYEKRISKIRDAALDELRAEWATKTTALEALAAQISELGEAVAFSIGGGKGKRARKSGGGSNATVFSGDIATVVSFIGKEAGDDGVATRRLSAEFGKPSEGWESALDGKAKKKGAGAAGRWFPK